ncbi:MULTISPECIES: helix-turn-helix transcriptional regulator [unclassified Streptomyces]|uniref:PadR family transcriptional regulator n=1 Tax=unclassified Streptomyces TaxID=2593676 RepID=UPI002E370E48|nr:helix-turn-helix transcriptional regulator [Streptomyces sp. NBC_01268]
MPPVFAHGRLRLYLLKLLDEAPRHGYEVIRLLEERFQGLYAPSAGTVYPRLAKLEAEGLVTHATEGGRKVYSITDAGRAELAGRGGELADLEVEIRESVSELAAEIRDDVRGAAGKLRNEMRAAASASRTKESSSFADAKEELRRARQEWREQTRQARAEAQSAKRQAKEFQRIARQVQEQVQEQVREQVSRGEWPKDVWKGISDITAQLGDLVTGAGHDKASRRGPVPDQPTGGAPAPGRAPAEEAAPGSDRVAPAGDTLTAAEAPGTEGSPAPKRLAPEHTPDQGLAAEYAPAPEHAPGKEQAHGPERAAADWAADIGTGGDPARELDRLLDRFRDEVRDAARDHGVHRDQLAEARRHLASAATEITALLRPRAKS